MKRLLLTTALSLIAGGAYAQTAAPAAPAIDDPLHICYVAPAACGTFVGVKIGTTNQGASGWGISSSPAAQEGHLVIAILVPQNEAELTFPTLTGTLNALPISGISAVTQVALFGPGQDLTAVLGIAASPPNPYSAYAPATAALDAGFIAGTSKYVALEVSVAGSTFQVGPTGGSTNILNNDFSLTGGSFVDPFLPGDPTETGLPAGTIITAFLEGTAHGNLSTAQSSSLAISPFVFTPPIPEPSTWAMMITAVVGMAFGAMFRRRLRLYA